MNVASQLNKNPIFEQIARAADKLKTEGYIVGGFVRDIILKRPSMDIDFVCEGQGIEWAREVANQLGLSKVTVFKRFGTAQIIWKGYNLEFVGARKESYQSDSRKPYVEEGTLEDDQKRRDFTINTLTIGLGKKNWGDVMDPFNGLADIKNKTIKTPLEPGITFSDDPLRMIRAIRFAAQLNFDIEPITFDAIRQNANRLNIVAMDRIIGELNKIVLSDKPSYGFKLLHKSELLNEFFPEMVALHGVQPIDGKAHKDNFYHTLQVLDNIAEVSKNIWLRWAAILHDIAKPLTKRFDPVQGWTFHGHEDKGARMVPKLFRQLKLPMQQNMMFVQKLVRLHLRPVALAQQVSDSAIRRLLFEAGDSIDDLMTLCRADITSKNHRKVAQYLKNFDKVEKKMYEIEQKDKIRCFQPPISGKQIIEELGITPGPLVGSIKEQIKNAILDGKIQNDKEQAHQLMLQIAKQKDLKQLQR